MAWDHSQVNGTLIFKGTFSITIRFINRDNNSNWACNSVYVPNERTLRSDFWNEVRLVKNLLSIPWAIYEDFNTTFNLEDKNKGDLNSRDIITTQNILDPPLHGHHFTRTNRQTDPIWIHLD